MLRLVDFWKFNEDVFVQIALKFKRNTLLHIMWQVRYIATTGISSAIWQMMITGIGGLTL